MREQIERDQSAAADALASEDVTAELMRALVEDPAALGGQPSRSKANHTFGVNTLQLPRGCTGPFSTLHPPH